MNDELPELAPIALGLVSSIHHSSFIILTVAVLQPQTKEPHAGKGSEVADAARTLLNP